MAMASVLAGSHDVTIGMPEQPDMMMFDHLGFRSDMQFKTFSEWRLTIESLRYDVLIYLTNDFPYPSFAKHSILIVQFPFIGFGAKSECLKIGRWPGVKRVEKMVERFLLSRFRLLAYSQYSRSWIKTRWGVDATVLNPPVELGSANFEYKKKVILSVGRFFPKEHTKRHDVMIEAYRRLDPELRKSWQLVLAGGMSNDDESKAYVKDIERMASEAGVELRVNVDRDELKELYKSAAIYWHAAGYGRQDDRPEDAEHFGITTVEAMSHGAVPVVFDDGGQQEVVPEGLGWRWRTIDELVRNTERLMNDSAERERMAIEASELASKYGEERFADEVHRFVTHGVDGIEHV